MADALHAINAVSRRTGLSEHVIRIWEKRYAAVRPIRTPTNRRLYSDEQLNRLLLLRQATEAGHAIGTIANLPEERLRSLVTETRKPAESPAVAFEPKEQWLEACLDAIKAFNRESLDRTLKEAMAELGAQGLLHRVIAPLAQSMGTLWREGMITAAHEHFATATLRVFLGQRASGFASFENAPVLVVGTPSGQLHELGALMAAAAAANAGWKIIYLGPSLPSAELAGAARQNRARAIALSVVYPEDDPQLSEELTQLRELLPAGTAIIAGGRATHAYRTALERVGAHWVPDLPRLNAVLDSLRQANPNHQLG